MSNVSIIIFTSFLLALSTNWSAFAGSGSSDLSITIVYNNNPYMCSDRSH
jgi:hypothetical protein